MPEMNEEQIRRSLDVLSQVKPTAESTRRVVGAIHDILTGDEQAVVKTKTDNISIWRLIMNSKLTKLSAAAVIILAVLSAMIFFGGTTSVTLAEVIESVKSVKSVVYRMKTRIDGIPGSSGNEILDTNSEIKLAHDIGLRAESTTKTGDRTIMTRSYIQFSEQLIISMNLDEKKYMKVTLTDEAFEKMSQQNGDPMTLLEVMSKYEYTELGEDRIDGIKVFGLEVDSPALGAKIGPVMGGGMLDRTIARLWVDVETQLPVRLTIEGSTLDGETTMKMTMDGYNWDVEIDESEFAPVIPDGFELLGEIKWDAGTEGAEIIEVLRLFVEFADGKYPESLSTMTVAKEIIPALRRKLPPDSEPDKELIGRLMNVDRVGYFYSTLVDEGKEPAYYGDKVTDEFPHAVLFRWKISDDTYRVVFGDLSARDVDGAELARLEALPLNQSKKAIRPVPADGTAGMDLEGLKLSWMSGLNAASHKIYFGDPGDLVLIGETTEESIEAPKLARGMKCFWRVDEVQADGSVVEGDEWLFETGSIVGYWNFDNASNIAADAGLNAIYGRLHGDVKTCEGIVGNAIVLDGDEDYVILGNKPAFDIEKQITIAVWIKVNQFTSEWQTVIAKGDSSWRLSRHWDRNYMEFGCSGVVVPGTQWSNITGKTNVNDGKWHHVAGTYDGKSMKIYVDGQLDISVDCQGDMFTNDQPVLVGANSEKAGRGWNGLIDELRIYDYALTEEEINELVNIPD